MITEVKNAAMARRQILEQILEQLGNEYDVVELSDDEANEYLRSIQKSFNAVHKSGDGRGLHFTFDGYRKEGRVYVSVKWPQSKERHDYRGKLESITMNYSRPVQKLAAEIKRRLLDSYDVQFRDQVAKRDGANDRRSKQLALASELAGIVGADNRDYHSKEPRDTFYTYGGCVVDKVEVHGDLTVKFESDYSLPAEVAKDVMRFAASRMKRYRAERREEAA